MSDEVEQGRRPARPPVLSPGRRRALLPVGLLVGALLVVLVTRGRPGPAPATPGSPTATPPAAGLTLGTTRCAGFDGTRLTLGFGVVNDGPVTVTVDQVDTSFPLGGFTPDPAAPPDRTACPGADTHATPLVAPGAETVLAFVLTPTRATCIAPLPVEVEVGDGVDGDAATQQFRPFPDLGGFGLPSECAEVARSPAGVTPDGAIFSLTGNIFDVKLAS